MSNSFWNTQVECDTKINYFAKRALLKLIIHVRNQTHQNIESITYKKLAFRIGRLNKHGEGHARGMGRVLSHMGRILLSLNDNAIPQISSLVVSGWGPNRGLPDEGISEFWPDYLQLTKNKKLDKVQEEYIKIISFGIGWDKVLSDLGIDQVS